MAKSIVCTIAVPKVIKKLRTDLNNQNIPTGLISFVHDYLVSENKITKNSNTGELSANEYKKLKEEVSKYINKSNNYKESKNYANPKYNIQYRMGKAKDDPSIEYKDGMIIISTPEIENYKSDIRKFHNRILLNLPILENYLEKDKIRDDTRRVDWENFKNTYGNDSFNFLRFFIRELVYSEVEDINKFINNSYDDLSKENKKIADSAYKTAKKIMESSLKEEASDSTKSEIQKAFYDKAKIKSKSKNSYDINKPTQIFEYLTYGVKLEGIMQRQPIKEFLLNGFFDDSSFSLNLKALLESNFGKEGTSISSILDKQVEDLMATLSLDKRYTALFLKKLGEGVVNNLYISSETLERKDREKLNTQKKEYDKLVEKKDELKAGKLKSDIEGSMRQKFKTSIEKELQKLYNSDTFKNIIKKAYEETETDIAELEEFMGSAIHIEQKAEDYITETPISTSKTAIIAKYGAGYTFELSEAVGNLVYNTITQYVEEVSTVSREEFIEDYEQDFHDFASDVYTAVMNFKDNPIELINLIGIEEFIKKSKEKLDIETDPLHEEVLKDFDTLFLIGTSYLEEMYGISLSEDGLFKMEESLNTFDDFDEENSTENNTEEGFGITALQKDPFKSANSTAKHYLRNIVEIDDYNNYVYDALGTYKKISPKKAFDILVKELYPIVVDSTDFCIIDESNNSITFPALEAVSKKYPWVVSLIDNLDFMYDENSEECKRAVAALYTSLFLSHKEYNSIDSSDSDKDVHVYNKDELTYSYISAVKLNQAGNNIMPNDYRLYCLYDSNGNYKKNAYEILEFLFEKYTEAIDDQEFYISKTEESVENAYKAFLVLCNSVGIKPLVTLEAFKNEETFNEIDRVVSPNFRELLKSLQDIKEGNKMPKSNIWDTDWQIYNELVTSLGSREANVQVKCFKVKSEKTNKVKSMYSYSYPNELELLLKKLKSKKHKNKTLTLYESSSLYYDKSAKKFRLKLLQDANNNLRANTFKNVGITYTITIDDTPYTECNKQQIRKAIFKQMFETFKIDGEAYARYPLFLPSDAPVLPTLKYPVLKLTDDSFIDIINQEIQRIKIIEARDEKKNDPDSKSPASLPFFDKTGKDFMAFPEFNKSGIYNEIMEAYNQYFKEPEKQIIIQDEKGKEITKTTKQIYNDIVKKYVNQALTERTQQFLDNLSVEESDEYSTILNIFLLNTTSKDTLQSDVIDKYTKWDGYYEYIRNSTYMMTQAALLYAGDFAFFKGDYATWQKRAKMIYAMGQQLCTAVMEKKIQRYVVAKDSEIASNTYGDLIYTIRKAVKEHRITQDQGDHILEGFRNITSTDGQSYRTLKSMVDIKNGLGEDTKAFNEALERLRTDKWDMGDFLKVLNVIKPSAYYLAFEDDGTNSNNKIPVPHYHKNSEFPLILGTLMTEKLNSNSPLAAISEWMEKNNIDVWHHVSVEKTETTEPIDVYVKHDILKTQSESDRIYSIFNSLNEKYEELKKSKGNILKKKKFEDIGANESHYNPSNYIKNYNKILTLALEEAIISYEEYKNTLKELVPTKEEITKMLNEVDIDRVVREMPYENYKKQQPTKDHFIDELEATVGSQIANHIIANIPDKAIFTLDGVEFNKKDLISLYKNTKMANIIDLYKNLAEEFDSIEKVQKLLLNQIRGDLNYTESAKRSLTIVTDEEGNKKFNIPLDDFLMSTKWEAVLLSAFKNNVTKQKARGGALVAVSDFGLSERLQIEYDEKGNPKAVQCLLPATSKKHFKHYIKKNENGKGFELDYAKMEKECPELLEALGYRIPTEAHYSMLPLKIVGFLPQNSGGTIMLPADVITLTGSDFDIKVY